MELAHQMFHFLFFVHVLEFQLLLGFVVNVNRFSLPVETERIDHTRAEGIILSLHAQSFCRRIDLAQVSLFFIHTRLGFVDFYCGGRFWHRGLCDLSPFALSNDLPARRSLRNDRHVGCSHVGLCKLRAGAQAWFEAAILAMIVWTLFME